MQNTNTCPVTLIKSLIQPYGYKEMYINPIGMGMPLGDVLMVVVVYEDDTKAKLDHYEIRFQGRDTVEAAQLPDYITLT